MSRLKNLKLHPACTLFPELPDDELEDLANDIAANGLQNPIVLYQGLVLDGRNRLKACRLARVQPRFVEFEGGDPIAWVVSQNLVRRHLTASQRAVVALDLLPLLEAEAKERQRLSAGRGRKKVVREHATLKNGKAAEHAARLTRSSTRYVEIARAVRAKAPELIEKIKLGRINIPDAEKLASIPEVRRRQILDEFDGDDAFQSWKKETRNDPPSKPSQRTASERRRRLAATTLICGDARAKMQGLPDAGVDLLLSDPIYPEVDRPYGRLTEARWHELMQGVVREAKRVLKPEGSAVFVLQPNSKRIGQMRIWLWEFLVWAAREWNLVQDAYWWSTNALPSGGASRYQGLLRPSTKMCIWLGNPTCYRNQKGVLWQPADDEAAEKWFNRAYQHRPSGHRLRAGCMAESAARRGGSTPHNLVPIATSSAKAAANHPAATPYDLASWWCRYLLPSGGVLLDPFCGSGTMLQAALDCGASKVIGIDKMRQYLTTAKKRVQE